MSKDSVTWSRVAVNGRDALGHPIEAAASGFPQTVRGNLQEHHRAAAPQNPGGSVRYDATFFSEEFTEGATGDRVTVAGRTYTVANVGARRSISSSALAFVRYDLNLVTVGVAQPTGA